MRNAKFISHGESQKSVDHECAKDHQDKKLQVLEMVGQDQRIADKDGTEKNIIQKVIHVVAPFDQAAMAMFAERSVERIGYVLRHDHDGHSPEPSKTALCQEAKQDDEQADGDGEDGQVIALDPCWHSWHGPRDRFLFEDMQQRSSYFFIPGKGWRWHIRRF